MLEFAVFALALLAELMLVRRLARPATPALWLLIVGGTALGAWVLLLTPKKTSPGAALTAVRQRPSSGYASSNACRSCHPAEYASWHDSYHRSMTEIATPESVKAPWDGVSLDWHGGHYQLFRRDEQFWATLPDPDRSPSLMGTTGNEVERQVLMTTGSHHYQAYWVRGARGNELWQFPFVYQLQTRRFLPRQDVFLQPPDDPPQASRWNSNCIQCHSVGGQPRHDLASDRFDSSVAELGIACEACHGPGGDHVARQQNPLTRYSERQNATADPSIVNPARLSAERGSEVCGQCHSYFIPNDADGWWQSGFVQAYLPGDALAPSRHVLEYESDRTSALLDTSLDSLFYTDGTIRVGGREWNGLKQSACFTRGIAERQLGCGSCHRLHGGTRDDQLDPDRQTDAVCASCHVELGREATAHSHHPAGTSGNECVNCHMPLTTYALLKGIRSHRITPPRANLTDGAAPNACNMCHLDQSLAWTAEWLERWYGRGAPPASTPTEAPDRAARDREHPDRAALGTLAVAAGVLAGDAATRVILANQMGWAPAQAASGLAWQAPLLVAALDDPYAAVRFVAARSLATLPGFEDFRYDFSAERERRLEQQQQARERLDSQSTEGPRRPRQPALALPVNATGHIDTTLVTALIDLRDPRPIRIAE